MKTYLATVLAIVMASYAYGSRADTLPTLTAQSGASDPFTAPPAHPMPIIFPSSSPPAANIGAGPLVIPGSGGRQLPRSCYQPIPRGARVDANQDVWLDGQKVEHISSCPESQKDIVPAAGWLESATQNAEYSHFTELFVEFYVPNAPSSPSSSVFFMWPGIEATSGSGYYLLQPVLQWNQGGHEMWTMQDWVVHNGTALDSDTAVEVNAGDEIAAEVIFDTGNPGASCNIGTGSNCNYWIYWFDVTQNNYGVSGGFEWPVPEPMNYAQGAVFEAYSNFLSSSETGFPVGCADFPGTSLLGLHDGFFGYTYLSEYSQSVTYQQDVPSFATTQYPNAGSGWLTDTNGNHVNCGDNSTHTFSIAAGFWSGSGTSGDYGFAVGY